MSLINDALKRASSEKPQASPQPASGPILQPVMSQPASSNYLLPISLLLLGFAVLVVAAVLWLRSDDKGVQVASNSGQPAAASPAPAGSPIGATPLSSQPVPATTQPAPPLAATPTPATTQGAASVQPAVNPVPVSTATPPGASASASTRPEATPVTKVSEPFIAKPGLSPAAAEPKPLKLQAIYYRLRGPSVVINGKTVRVGDVVDGARVVSIQRSSVEVVRDGQYETLTLPD